jgi:hypothetical protein
VLTQKVRRKKEEWKLFCHMSEDLNFVAWECNPSNDVKSVMVFNCSGFIAKTSEISEFESIG